MFIMKKLVVFLCFFRVCLCVEAVVGANGVTAYVAEVKEDEEFPNDSDNEILNATLFRTVKKYYCSADTDEDAELIVYGTKAWTFPTQDVNLTLRYPSENHDDTQEDIEHVDYILTGLKVVFHLSGSDSKGYITSGGMHQNHISMTFVFHNITNLSYQFYLHGVPKNSLNVTENYTATVNLC